MQKARFLPLFFFSLCDGPLRVVTALHTEPDHIGVQESLGSMYM